MCVEDSSTHRLTSSVEIPALLNDPAPPKPSQARLRGAALQRSQQGGATSRSARLGLRVKKMIGGVTGWIGECFTLTPS
jgi:hypothetical protein